jgi:hypothetical protein
MRRLDAQAAGAAFGRRPRPACRRDPSFAAHIWRGARADRPSAPCGSAGRRSRGASRTYTEGEGTPRVKSSGSTLSASELDRSQTRCKAGTVPRAQRKRLESLLPPVWGIVRSADRASATGALRVSSRGYVITTEVRSDPADPHETLIAQRPIVRVPSFHVQLTRPACGCRR